MILIFRNHEKSNVGMFGEAEIFGHKSAWESHYALATKTAPSVDEKLRISIKTVNSCTFQTPQFNKNNSFLSKMY